jgi:hypothetical protein
LVSADVVTVTWPVSVAVDAEPVDDVTPPPVVAVDDAEPVEDSPADVEVFEVLVFEVFEVFEAGSALASPGEAITNAPIPKAAASAPTRPMYRPQELTCEVCEYIAISPRGGYFGRSGLPTGR